MTGVDGVDWGRRTREFGAVREFDDGRPIVVMEFDPQSPPALFAAWLELRERWLELPAHPNVLEAIEANGPGVLLRYAPLDWRHRTRRLDRDHDLSLIASHGIQLVDVYQLVAREVPADDVGRFLRPLIKLDVEGQLQIGFLPASPLDRKTTGNMAPEVVPAWPRCDEHGLVFLVGAVLPGLWMPGEHATGGAHLAALVARCLAPAPEDRFANLAEVRAALIAIRCAVSRLWVDLEPRGLVLERDRAFAEALTLYHQVGSYESGEPRVQLAIARCNLALGVARKAIDYARHALSSSTADADRVDAHALLVRAYSFSASPHDALTHADALLQLDATGPTHYLRGRCLFALGRFVEAKASFERAVALDPTLVEAMLLRREADRALAKVRHQTGVPAARVIEVPEELAALRAVLVAGRTTEAIAILEGPDYTGNPVAELVLAACVAFEGDHARALALYDRVADRDATHRHRALVGKAGLLLEAGRADEALAVFDRLDSHAAIDVEVIEGRARALERLGRHAEAEAALRRFVALAEGRTDLRVRSTR